MCRRSLSVNRPIAKADLAHAAAVRAMVRVMLSSKRGANGVEEE